MQAGERRTFDRIALVIAAMAILASLRGAEFDPAALFSPATLRAGGRFLAEWWPPNMDPRFLRELALGAITTIAIAWLGTMVAIVVAVPLALLGSRIVIAGTGFTRGDRRAGRLLGPIFVLARLLAAFLRSVPEVLWGLVFVRVYGLGALPAIAAIGVAYGGMLAKVYSEQLEAVARRPVAALETTGASRLAVFWWSILPQAFGSMADYTMYRFECAIRASVLMGFIGAQGLGQRLMASYSFSQYSDVCSEALVLVLAVAAIEVIADLLRRWIG